METGLSEAATRAAARAVEEVLAELDRLGFSYSKLHKETYSAWWKPMAEAPPVTDRLANLPATRPAS